MAIGSLGAALLWQAGDLANLTGIYSHGTLHFEGTGLATFGAILMLIPVFDTVRRRSAKGFRMIETVFVTGVAGFIGESLVPPPSRDARTPGQRPLLSGGRDRRRCRDRTRGRYGRPAGPSRLALCSRCCRYHDSSGHRHWAHHARSGRIPDEEPTG